MFLSLPAHAGWQVLARGIAYQKLPMTRATLHAFKINLEDNEIRPILLQDWRTASVTHLAQKNSALIGVNANFFDEKGWPLGLVVNDGKALNPYKKISWWSVFYTVDKKAAIVHGKGYPPVTSLTAAIQAGPRLVINGAIPKLKEKMSAKTALGINYRGEVFLLATSGRVSMDALARKLAALESRGGLGLKDALNLDGGSSTQLYTHVGDFKLEISGLPIIPVGIGVFPR